MSPSRVADMDALSCDALTAMEQVPVDLLLFTT